MRLQTVSIILALFIGLGFQKVQAQIVASNPLEWMALAEGNELINNQIDKQINGQTKTAILQNTIAAEFNQIHKWEKKYNSYLKTANGYASSLKHVRISTAMVYAFYHFGKAPQSHQQQSTRYCRLDEHEQPLR